MTKNKYAIGVGIAILFLAVGYWVGTMKNIPGTEVEDQTAVVEENATTTADGPTPSAPVVSQPKPAVPKAFAVARGRFSGSGGHTSWGGASIEWTGTSYVLKFGSDFLVTSGPDLYVYLGRVNQYEPGFKVGLLQNVTGAQTYALSASPKDPRYYDEVLIWNEPNSLPFAKAVLTAL